MLIELLSGLLVRFGARSLASRLPQVYGGSFTVFLGRLLRLRRTAGAMVRADSSPPLPIRLQIETTDICNLKCRMCTREVIEGMNTRTMSLEQFRGVVTQASPLYVTLNGLGEPLSDRSIFDKLRFLHDRDITTAMPTNGSHVRGEKLMQLAENLPDITTFSIDGASRETFEHIRVLGNYDNIVAGYRALMDLHRAGKTRPNTKVQILCALQKANLRDFATMYQLLKSMDAVDSFRLTPVFDFDPEGNAFAGLIPEKSDVLKLHGELHAAIARAADPEEKDFYRYWGSVAADWLGEPDDKEMTGGACIIPWYSTYVDAKGRVYPCCYLTTTNHVMGNVNEQPFPAIWSGESYRTFRNELATNRANLVGCRTCPRNDDRRLQDVSRFKILLS